MIISRYFGNPKLGRNLGNQLFELAALIGLAKRYNTTLLLPSLWQYRSSFNLGSSIEYGDVEAFVSIREPAFHCCLEFFDKFENIIKDERVYIEGYFQSELYWKPFEDEIRKAFDFTTSIEKDTDLFLIENNVDVEKMVAVSVRRGDFVTDPNHYLLPLEYYVGALSRFFPEKDIMVFSDDITWCKEHFNLADRRVVFSENKSAIEQLSLMSRFANFVLANSTFSWWGAYLSKTENKKVIRPYYHFDGELKIKNSLKDHYPSSWIIYNHYNINMNHPVYIVNLPQRTDRREHILAQFLDRPEFIVHIKEPVVHTIGAVSLWLTLRNIVKEEKEKGSPYFILCEDDHTFTNAYSTELLEKCILRANSLQADVLSGGVSWFSSAMRTDDTLFWIEQFTGMQFTVIYNRFYERLLESPYDDFVVTDFQISKMTLKKWMIYPYISVQTEFGYSDVTKQNNDAGFVGKIFHTAMNRFDVLDRVVAHYQLANLGKNEYELSDLPSDIAIPTYVINMKQRPERLKHVLSQFEGKTEFDIHVVEACKHEIGAVGLWQSIVKIIKEIVNGDDDVIIICEDDHTFTLDYCREEFMHHVIKAAEQGVEVLSGGIGGFGSACPIGTKRYWIDWLWCTQFIVVYRPFFQRILDEPFTDTDTADGKISEMTSNKAVIYPFISIQHDFGYSDVTRGNNESKGKITEYFRETDKRFGIISGMLRYHNEVLDI